MNRLNTPSDHRSGEQRRLYEADRFDRMARPNSNVSFAALAQDARTHAIDTPGAAAQILEDHDWSRFRGGELKASSPSELDYFRARMTREMTAARDASDKRVRRVHLEMAERYRALISNAESDVPVRSHAVS